MCQLCKQENLLEAMGLKVVHKEPGPEPKLPRLHIIDSHLQERVVENLLKDAEATVFTAYLNMVANRHASREAIAELRKNMAVSIRSLEDLKREFRPEWVEEHALPSWLTEHRASSEADELLGAPAGRVGPTTDNEG